VKRPGRFSLLLMLLPVGYFAAVVLIGGMVIYT
jgi:hypothetical protein